MKYVLLVYLLTGYAPGPVFHTFSDRVACEAAAQAITQHVKAQKLYVDCYTEQSTTQQ